jgi:hypothetical protein
MADNTPAVSLAEIEARLREAGRLLRENAALDPQARQNLAGIVEEMATSLQSSEVQSEAATSLAGTTAHLADAVHQQHEPQRVEAARTSLEAAVLEAAARAPVAADLANRFLVALASIGI